MNKSKQRDVVYSVLNSTFCHPTAEWVYDKAKEILPDISKGTVYRNLKELTDTGKIIQVQGVFQKDRYDADITPHAHLVCRECGEVVDFTPKDILSLIKLGQVDGACLEEYSLIYHGLCAVCNKAAKVNNKKAK